MQDFKEFAFALLVIALVIAGVQWLLLRFTHWVIVLTATGLMSIIIASVYVQLKNSSPNGGSSGPDFGEYIVPTFVVFTLLFCGFLLICYLMQYQLPIIAYKLTFGSIALFAILRFGYREIKNVTFYNELFSKCEIKVVDKTGGKSILKEIVFKNTSNGLITNKDPYSKAPSEPRIARFADKIIFYSNSVKTNRRTAHEFPFDYSLCMETQQKGEGLFFWIQTKSISPMIIVFLPDDKAELYIDGNFIKQYQFSDTSVSEKD